VFVKLDVQDEAFASGVSVRFGSRGEFTLPGAAAGPTAGTC
jgi:hypothetical protein